MRGGANSNEAVLVSCTDCLIGQNQRGLSQKRVHVLTFEECFDGPRRGGRKGQRSETATTGEAGSAPALNAAIFLEESEANACKGHGKRRREVLRRSGEPRARCPKRGLSWPQAWRDPEQQTTTNKQTDKNGGAAAGGAEARLAIG